jgi:plasmid stabilization system protein ParE
VTGAEQDLDEIWLYVAEDASPATADRLNDALVERFDLLTDQPAIERLRPEFGTGVRSFVAESYASHRLPMGAHRSSDARVEVSGGWNEACLRGDGPIPAVE